MSESVVYVIKNKRLDLYMTILDTDLLHLHEETIPELLEQLVFSIRADGFIKHPIIADKESLIVLDGVHRIIALEKLSIRRVPACLVNYNSPHIEVCSWYRTITDASNPARIAVQVDQQHYKKIEEFDENSIGVSPTVAAIRFVNQTFLVSSPFQDQREKHTTSSCALRNT